MHIKLKNILEKWYNNLWTDKEIFIQTHQQEQNEKKKQKKYSGLNSFILITRTIHFPFPQNST